MTVVSCPCNPPSLPLRGNKIATKTRFPAAFSVTSMMRPSSNSYTTKTEVGCVATPPQTLLQFSSDSLQYEQGKVGAVPDGGVSESSVSAMEYLTRILTSKVYDVAVESPLQHATKLSERLGVDIWLKREDAQSVSNSPLVHTYKCKKIFIFVSKEISKTPNLFAYNYRKNVFVNIKFQKYKFKRFFFSCLYVVGFLVQNSWSI